MYSHSNVELTSDNKDDLQDTKLVSIIELSKILTLVSIKEMTYISRLASIIIVTNENLKERQNVFLVKKLCIFLYDFYTYFENGIVYKNFIFIIG